MVEPFWKSNLSDIEQSMAEIVRGRSCVLASSAGGREIYVAEYGEKEDFGRTANYNSACGAGSTAHYAHKGEGAKPVLLLVGGVHGGELEGIAAVLNLIRLLETGADYRGKRHDYVHENADRFRLLLIPCLNPDGRARLPVDTLIGTLSEQFVYWMQGSWKDGSLCTWTACKSVHPIKDAADFLGSYFNDDGVNFMHDNFFAPMAVETAALLALADREAVDFHVSLHGGANEPIHFPAIAYLPAAVRRKQQSFNERMAEACGERGLPFTAVDQWTEREGGSPPSFNLTSAVHHACGGMSMTFESNMGLDAPGARLSAEEILDSHFLLFEEMFRFMLK
ncbi:M14 family zinc carboxypeptidase [Paenibacillus sacheonensis]|uniref:Peptidase M14 domain-containing protein n=1 Tax=Paenibacillus sacheonensis TaxID=742054 RepID=A0A7X5BZI1_9BACL|nr:M14 family zinc carboxypeptidase [Paenibacillus sacheonensis]MBM7564294.1 hypothetical protein [Paenibacillus sacheonensis]NBC67384.1 hypothetical protein [Paenibacillus sacheonensis]